MEPGPSKATSIEAAADARCLHRQNQATNICGLYVPPNTVARDQAAA